MTARDKFHNLVKQALIQEGWTITADPLQLRYGGVDTYVDLAADHLIAAEKPERKIAVEVKSFLSDSITYEFHAAVGQFVNYRIILGELQPDRKLYLAVPSDVYHTFFIGQFAHTIVQQAGLSIIVYDSDEGGIKQWIS